MDKSAIKKFAVMARTKLIEDVQQKAYELGITKGEIQEPEEFEDGFRINQKIFKKYEIKQRKKLLQKIKEKGYDQIVDEVAYTWFNRFIALRFMEVNDYLPTGVRVLSSEDEGKMEPDIIAEALTVDLDVNEEIIYRLQDENDTEDLYKYLLIKQCNKLHEILSGMFEQIEDYTELLLPNNLLHEGSVIYELVTTIPWEDWKEQVEIIGWLYQFYISEKKDQVFADLKKNKKITKENIPAATQLFTPKWIVQYMVENSLGRLWLESHPDENLQAQWKYYLEEAEQEPDAQKQLEELKNKDLNPEEIKVLDPCMGSGHILVYAFDVLYQIYKSAGYSLRDIPKLIVEKNLYGLEIDDRAAQLAYFAVIMKARSYNRRFFREKVQPNLCSIQESNSIPKEAIDYLVSLKSLELEKPIRKEEVEYLINVFHDAKEYGSILEVKDIDLEAIEQRIEEIRNGETVDLFEEQYRDIILNRVPHLVRQARVMLNKHEVVVTNPPYMGHKGMNSNLLKYVKVHYPNSKNDCGTVFIERCLSFSVSAGYTAIINIPSWMFLGSFERLRKKVIKNSVIYSLIHLGRGIFGSDFGTVSFVLRNSIINNYKGLYKRLFDKQGSVDSLDDKQKKYFESGRNYCIHQNEFSSIPGIPIAYWTSNIIRHVFKESKMLGDILKAKQGIATADNNRFLRLWHEVNIKRVEFNVHNNNEIIDAAKWIPYNKGGSFRKWYGNQEYIIDWENNGRELKNFPKSVVRNPSFYFKKGITWSDVTISNFSARFIPNGFIFDSTGPTMFTDDNNIYEILGYVNSNVFKTFLKITMSGLHFNNGIMGQLPYLYPKTKEAIGRLVMDNIKIIRNDWDSFETSWDFKKHPFLMHKSESGRIEDTFNNWSIFNEHKFNQLKASEEELNRIFIDLYGLEDELTPDVLDEEITIRKVDRERDVKSFIFYAVGCMFGRYSLDEEGLIYAGGEFNPDRYQMFKPDANNVIPITDDEYFEDDIVTRFIEFVKVTFGEENLEENLNFIADSLKKKTDETSRQRIRRYFLKEFYKDHVQTYKKRPIYWMFDSGKQNGFKALIYMHRYEEALAAQVRTENLHLLQRKYEAAMERLDDVAESDVSTREKNQAKKKKERIQKQIIECRQYDQVIAHIANQRININLDDGVKVNYSKFLGVKVPQGEGKAPEKMDVLSPIKL